MKKYILLLTIAFLTITLFVHAQAGTLDKTFGVGGKVSTDFAFKTDIGNEVVIQPDKKIFVVGTVNSGRAFGVVRYLANGNVDTSFGTNGKVIKSFYDNTLAEAFCGILQPDEKIIIGGYRREVSEGTFLVLVRYNANGSVDSSFGINGIVNTNPGSYNEGFRSLYVLPDGKILAAAIAEPSFSNTDFFLYRYKSNGEIDSTFGNNGKAITDFGYDYVYEMAVQRDGKIVLCGDTYDYRVGKNKLMMTRYSANGVIDAGFGDKGVVITTLGLDGDLYCNSMVLQPDGKFVVAANKDAGQGYVSVAARFLKNGSPDNGFGIGGIAENSFRRGHYCNGIGIKKDGKIVIGGYAYKFGNDINEFGNFAITQLESNGKIDSAFGNDGITITNIDNQTNRGNALAIQDDEKILLAGISSNSDINSGDFAIVRYNSERKRTAIEVLKNLQLKVYPNPVKNILQIEGLPANTKTKLTVTDLTGTARIVTTVNGSTYTLNVAQLTKGNYMIKIESGSVVVTKQFIKE